MRILINNTELDLQAVNTLIAKGKKLNAIKYIRNQTKIGLKESKNIADNLDNNPDFYNGESEIILDYSNLVFEDNHQKSHKHSKRGNHIIRKKQGSFKSFIIIALLICLIIIFYLYLKK